MWLEISMFGAKTLIEGVDKEYLSWELKFRTFGSMSQKLWPNNYVTFFCKWVVWGDKKYKNKNSKTKNSKLVFLIYIYTKSFESLYFDQWVKSYEG